MVHIMCKMKMLKAREKKTLEREKQVNKLNIYLAAADKTEKINEVKRDRNLTRE